LVFLVILAQRIEKPLYEFVFLVFFGFLGGGAVVEAVGGDCGGRPPASSPKTRKTKITN